MNNEKQPKQKSGFFGKIFKLIGILVVGIIVLSLLGGEEKPNSIIVKKGDGSTQEQAEPNIEIGDIFSTKKFEIQIKDKHQMKEIGEGVFSSTANEGAIYVGVIWNYKNISDKPIGAFSTPDLKLIDPNGNKYDPDIGASTTFATVFNVDEKAFSDLNPGITAKAVDVFEVSEQLFNFSTWKILVDADQDIEVRFK